MGGFVFIVAKNRALGNIWELRVNFDDQIVSLFKEIRHLSTFGFPVPHSVIANAKDAKRAYPFAVSLAETVRTYRQTLTVLAGREQDLGILVADFHNEVHVHIQKGTFFRYVSRLLTRSSFPRSTLYCCFAC